jgi:ribosomal protein L31E
MDSGDAERQARDMDITREERRYLARNSLVERLGVDPRLAEYLLELRERIEKLEDRLKVTESRKEDADPS